MIEGLGLIGGDVRLSLLHSMAILVVAVVLTLKKKDLVDSKSFVTNWE